MNIDTALLTKVLAQVALGADSREDELVTALRSTFPDVHFSVCSDDDMLPPLAAVAESAVCRLYYVDSSAHCLRLTSDAEAASGLVVALRDPEGES